MGDDGAMSRRLFVLRQFVPTPGSQRKTHRRVRNWALTWPVRRGTSARPLSLPSFVLPSSFCRFLAITKVDSYIVRIICGIFTRPLSMRVAERRGRRSSVRIKCSVLSQSVGPDAFYRGRARNFASIFALASPIPSGGLACSSWTSIMK